MSGKQYAAIIGLLLSIVILLNLPPPAAWSTRAVLRDNLTPFHAVIAFVARQFHGVGWYLSGLWHAPESEQALRTENAELRRELWRMRHLREENEALRSMAGMRETRKERLLIGEVISRGETTGWWETLRVNRGSLDGVRSDLAVITHRGLVGRVTGVSRFSCDVLLVTDPSSQVSCRLAGTGAFGILRGVGVTARGDHRLQILAGAPGARLDYLPSELPVKTDDEVLTSGLGGMFPEGLPVGRVCSVRLDPSRLYLTADVVPAADLKTLRYVFIMMSARNTP